MVATGEYYDDLETRDPEQREAANMAALAAQVARAKGGSAWYADILEDIDPQDVTSREALARLPVTRKHDLIGLMKDRPPFGGLNSIAVADAAVIFTSPGPIYEFMTARPDFYGAARGLYAAGFREGDIIHNSFSYHLTPGAWIMHDAARALGCPVIPGGIGNTEQQVAVMAQIRPSGWAGTPDYLRSLLEKGEELGADLGSVKLAYVGGGPLFPALRKEYNDRGIDVFQNFGTAELGVIAYESRAFDGMIVSEDKIVEILVPGTGNPVAKEGDVGEIVVTSLNPDYPLIRFATGDLSAVMAGTSPCGRSNLRIKGWMGRADQTTKVRGMFVHPEQVAEVVRRHPEIARARLIVDAKDSADLAIFRCETEGGDDRLADTIAETFRNVCKVRGDVEFVPPSSLPNDGLVIEDARKFD